MNISAFPQSSINTGIPIRSSSFFQDTDVMSLRARILARIWTSNCPTMGPLLGTCHAICSSVDPDTLQLPATMSSLAILELTHKA
jgi:hypothetical protein